VKAHSVRFQATQQAGRLDHALVKHVPQHSRSRLQQLIHAGYVTVNQAVITKCGFQLQGGEWVEVRLPAPSPSSLEAERIPLDIVYEDDNLIVVNKPAGMVVHPSAGHSRGTLVHAALAHAPDMRGVGGEIRPGVVHRLDKDTSGLILLAKNDFAQQWLQRQFKERRVEKVYLALVDGFPPTSSGRVEAPIGRDPRNRKRMAVVGSGKGRQAVTVFRTLETFGQHALLEIRPETGRTHQIRIHMAFLGCPVAGDRVYGRRKPTLPLARHFLHAAQLNLRLPGDEQSSTFSAPLPDDLQRILDELT
jgi:23S rRNA pseudouridine1911/1915/1917 synthase